ncbi:MAG: zinc-dependent metalloprotease [Chloroflexi bacterium]|nr:zinc-dependent metalloprotease [Chloroflexota bacterium]MCL5074445.1 zinc-dependent metalloprotease [Chloroflexota bacterium]
MARYKVNLTKGLLFGAMLGAFWVASRRYSDYVPRLINWERVRRLAVRIALQKGGGLPLSRTELSQRYGALVHYSAELIARYTGQKLPQPLESVFVFDRIDWIDANLANFKLLFEPLERVNWEALRSATIGSRLFGGLSQVVLSAQLGALMGYLSQRVLGQYDLSLLGKEPLTAGQLYFVEPNILDLERHLGLSGEDLRLWIGLHETTHAYEFEAHPWLRDYWNSLLRQYIESISAELMRVQSDGLQWRRLVGHIGSGLFRSRYLLELVMAPEQRRLFHQIQALMCLVEGFSNHVMDQAGRALLPNYKLLKTYFEERLRQKSAAERLFIRLTGLDVKLEQYALGERFVAEVVRRQGIEFLNLAWQSPATLPTLEEVHQPRRWIDRIRSQMV